MTEAHEGTRGNEATRLREALAEYAHEAWSNWMRYLFSKCDTRIGYFSNGEVICIPAWAVDRWQRQMNTPYDQLSQEEKESDRTEADAMLAIMQAAQAAEHAEYKSAWLAMVREIANLDEVINPDDAMGQADDGDLLEHFDPWQTLREVRQHIAELEKQAAEHAAALKIAYGEGFSIALGRVRELESQLAECSEKLAGHVWAYSTDLEDDE